MTLLRKAEYKALAGLVLTGEVLDLGGTRESAYHHLFQGTFKVSVANNDPHAQPDLVCDFEQSLPLPDARYDGALLINVLEHIFEYRAFLGETARVLKQGGDVVVVVPYLFPRHASPDDFHRYSASALTRALMSAGFTSIHVMPLGTGVCAARWQLIERLLPAPLRSASVVAEPLTRVFDGLVFALARQMGKQYLPSDYALGFVVTARKT